MGGRGRRHDRDERQHVLALIDEAVAAGARQSKACEVLGLSERTIQRWRNDPDGADGRKGPHTPCAHALTVDERQEIIDVATHPDFCDLSPRQIVCQLADQGRYIASESTFYRVLRDHRMVRHRQPSRPATPRPKPQRVARRPGQVWVWDITYLATPVRGRFAYLYWVMDLFSRKIVGWHISDRESMDESSRLIEQTILAERLEAQGLCIHADNGAAMRGSTLLATLERLGVESSFSRPGVSNDNAHCEASFRTLKYRPGYPKRPMELGDWRRWVADFVDWYNTEHYHSGIGWVTPQQRHDGQDRELLARRRELWADARQRHPKRWSGKTRRWPRPAEVRLAPAHDDEQRRQLS